MLDPSLIILDEPSMGLAPKVLRSVFGAITMMNEAGKTVLLVEQNARRVPPRRAHRRRTG